MKPTQDTYPVFAANQVLTNAHLNQVFDYLDEQERLTRANLVGIGIGIVCGCEAQFDATMIRLSRGCGVTSEGYLIVEPEDTELVGHREYALPNDVNYPPFKDITLRELFPAGEPNITALDTAFLSDKAVLLFLELKKEDLRNCRPDNCDDKGQAVTAKVRRLLISLADLDAIIAAAHELETGLTPADLADKLLHKLNLPDLRGPRYDVPNTNPATSNAVLAAFHAVFRQSNLAAHTAQALTAAYEAFRPLLQHAYPDNPFAGFMSKFGFLDTIPQKPEQVRFLQYYYDFFDDLLRAYDEFRWRGAELLCYCCPPERLFPRHLMLGATSGASLYRQTFMPSPALSGCETERHELAQLFRRLVEMAAQFTNNPPLPELERAANRDDQIRITPSKLGNAPLADRCIPYYYPPAGDPPLYQLWSPEKTRRGREKQNLSYHAPEYANDPFVTDPLRYDLEPYNFLRIEGHLGKNYQRVLQELLAQTAGFRLPVEIIALRTGAFDEKMPVDVHQEACHFQDLATLYETLKAELTCFLCREVVYFYDLPLKAASPVREPAKPALPLLARCAPDFRVKFETWGRLFEDWLSELPGRTLSDLNPVLIGRFLRLRKVNPEHEAIFWAILHSARLSAQLTEDLGQLSFADFANSYQNLADAAADIKSLGQQAIANLGINWEELRDRLEAIIYHCRLDAFRALVEEFKRRLREAKQKQFLSHFLQKHPGIQHKAGVPLGGTFILVYHDDPDPVRPVLGPVRPVFVNRPRLTRNAVNALTKALANIRADLQLARNPDVLLAIETLAERFPAVTPADADKIIATTVNQLADGTVIADFYLPYLCRSDCSPMQFVLPNPALTFTAQIGRTEDNQAQVTLAPVGGIAPYSVRVDNATEFIPLAGPLSLSAGPHTLTLRDAVATESAPRTITVAPSLVLGEPEFKCEAGQYVAVLSVTGGTPPYIAVAGGTLTNSDTFTTNPTASGETVAVELKDSNNSTVARELQHTCCNLPCAGQSRRSAYRLWLQPPADPFNYKSYEAGEVQFRLNGENFALPNAGSLLKIPLAQLNRSFQKALESVVKKLNESISQVLAAKFGAELGANRFIITYVPSDTDAFGVLLIEHFVCETFNLEFGYSFAKPNTTFSLLMRYTNEPDAAGVPFEGTILRNNRLQKETKVPAFDGSERNQCTGLDYQKLCAGLAPEIFIKVDPRPNNPGSFTLVGRARTRPLDDVVAWVWEVPGASEPFYQGENVDVQVDPNARNVKVRLTAITRKGCLSIAEEVLP